ncbi:hypothetical protein BDBG_16257, partial [Blastomyces gilchristii SLH14081]
SSHIDRFTSADDSELNIESLIENLKNMIMKELFMSCIIRSFTSLSAFSVSFSATSSQSSTPASMSGSPAFTTSVPATLTSATSGFIISAFIISSSYFKKILCRLNKSCFSAFTSVSEIILIEDDNITETTFFYSQASSVTFSPFSAEKIVHTSDYKHSAL